MEILHNPRCAKSRETLKILTEKGVEFDIVEYLKNVPSHAEMTLILKKLGMKAEDLIRKSEPVFKTFYKDKNLSESEWIDAMVAEPKLIERPIVIKGDKAIIGRPPEKVLELL